MATSVLTSRRAALATVVFLAAASVTPKIAVSAPVSALSAELERLAVYEALLWRDFDGDDPHIRAEIDNAARRMDAVLADIDALPGASIAELKLKARAAAYFAEPELYEDSSVRERLVATILSRIAA